MSKEISRRETSEISSQGQTRSLVIRVRTIVPSYYRIGRQSDYQTTIAPADCFRPIVFQ